MGIRERQSMGKEWLVLALIFFPFQKTPFLLVFVSSPRSFYCIAMYLPPKLWWLDPGKQECRHRYFCVYNFISVCVCVHMCVFLPSLTLSLPLFIFRRKNYLGKTQPCLGWISEKQGFAFSFHLYGKLLEKSPGPRMVEILKFKNCCSG